MRFKLFQNPQRFIVEFGKPLTLGTGLYTRVRNAFTFLNFTFFFCVLKSLPALFGQQLPEFINIVNSRSDQTPEEIKVRTRLSGIEK